MLGDSYARECSAVYFLAKLFQMNILHFTELLCTICAILRYHTLYNACNIVQFKLDNVRIGDSRIEQFIMAFAMHTTLRSPRQSRLETVVVGAR